MDAGDWPDVFAKYGDSMLLQVKVNLYKYKLIRVSYFIDQICCNNDILEQFQNKFNIKDSSTHLLRLQAFATDAMQRLYRFWKSRLHSYYKECRDTFEERLQNPPTDFPIESWKACCAKFDDDKFKVILHKSESRLNFSLVGYISMFN